MGTRWASTNSRGERNPRDSTAEPGGGASHGAAQRHDVAGTGTGAGDGRAAAEMPQRGDREHDDGAGRDVAADDGGAGRLGLGPQRRPDGDRGRGGGGGRADEPDEQRRGGGAHGGDVGEVHRGGLAPDLFRRGPVEPEVHALDQHVGGDDHTRVGGVTSLVKLTIFLCSSSSCLTFKILFRSLITSSSLFAEK